MTELHPIEAGEYEDALLELAFGVEASQGQFKLILARCNHRQLRSRAIAGLKSLVESKIQELQLVESTQTLLKTIQSTVTHPFPDALTIWGFESVGDLDRLLNATNQVREEFRKFPFPMILWVNDEVLRKLILLVPDFESWATITEFTLATAELTDLLTQQTKRIFRELLSIDASRFLMGHPLMKPDDRREFNQILHELRSRKVNLEQELRADVQFILGRHAYEQDELEVANQHYSQSLSFWESSSDRPLSIPALEKQAIVLLHLGLSSFRLADLRSTQSREHWQTARRYFQACIEVLDAANRRDLVSRFATYLSEVLRYLEAWKELKHAVDRSLPLHQKYGRPLQLAADYGFLAEIAIQDRHWSDVEYWATQALKILETISIDTPHAPYHFLLNQFYRLLLVKAQFKRQKTQQAIQNLDRAAKELEAALEASTPCYDPHRYLRILDALWRLYFDEGRYAEAFQIKLKRRSVAAAYGFRAFIGAGRLEAHQEALALARNSLEERGSVASEIQTSRRQQDVKNLLERVLRHDGKLTIMYGPSGVGKSSLIHAGLIPAVQALPNLRKTVPVVVQVYTDWCRELGKKLAQALGTSRSGLGVERSASSEQSSIEKAKQQLIQSFLLDGDCCISTILAELRKNDERNLQTVLIFEQFEEFFFNYQTLSQRRTFYEFLDEVWKMSYVTLIISIREDYFDNLLEIERLTDLDLSHQDLLTRKNRYYLGNFLQEDARKIIKSLTARSHFYLEEKLIDRLVLDLARDQGEVRPIELQIVGARLQEEDIHTLEKYEQTGTLTQLVQRYIDEAIEDCGAENQKIAQLILYFLTADNQTRLLKTKAELAQDLGENTENLDVVLKILRKSGLIVSLPEIPHHQYKLVHDYLVPIIRRQQKLAKQAEEQKFRQEYQLLRERDEAREKQKQSDTRFIRVLKLCLIGAVISVIGLGVFAWLVYRAEKAAAIAEIEAQNSASKAMLLSDKQFDALFTSVKAGKKLQKLKTPSQPILTSETLSQLQQAFHSISERNRLEGHSNNVLDVAFSANGKFIATASTDETVKLWSPNGTPLYTFDPGQKAITSASFSPDSQLLATSGNDPTVKLWQIQECDNDSICVKPFVQLQGHQAEVNRVSFSPDGLYLVTASRDNTVKLWKRDGTFVKTLSGHTNWVLDVSFSPDGKTIASASRDKTVRLWNRQGTTLKILQGHEDGVSSVAFSPDGKTIATGGADRRIKLWSWQDKSQGKLLHTLKKPNGDRVLDVSFSPDGKRIASAHEDNTVRLWTLDGQPIRTLSGHRKPVRSLAFSPDRQTLATSSEDNTVKLWDVDRNPNWQPHHSQGVLAVSFSPDGQMLATASEDKTVKLWPRQGKHPPKTLSGHTQAVNWVGFSPDGQTLASGSDDGLLRLWDRNGLLLQSLSHGDAVKSASFSQDSQTIATAGETTLKLWTVRGKLKQVLTFEETAQVQSVALSPDGQWIVTGHSDKTVRLWTIEGQPIDTQSGHMGTVNWVSFSPDGQTIASASQDKTVQLWKLKNGSLESIRALQGHIGQVNWVSFSPDGQTIASAGSDRTVKLWQAEDGQLLTTFEGHQAAVWSIAFSPDSKTLASASKDNTVLLWNLDLDKLLANSCDWIEDYLQHNQTVKDRDRDLCSGKN